MVELQRKTDVNRSHERVIMGHVFLLFVCLFFVFVFVCLFVCFLSLIPFLYTNFLSLIPKAWQIPVSDPTKKYNLIPDASKKKTADPDPLACGPWSRVCVPRSHPSDPCSHIPRYNPTMAFRSLLECSTTELWRDARIAITCTSLVTLRPWSCCPWLSNVHVLMAKSTVWQCSLVAWIFFTFLSFIMLFQCTLCVTYKRCIVIHLCSLMLLLSCWLAVRCLLCTPVCEESLTTKSKTSFQTPFSFFIWESGQTPSVETTGTNVRTSNKL